MKKIFSWTVILVVFFCVSAIADEVPSQASGTIWEQFTDSIIETNGGSYQDGRGGIALESISEPGEATFAEAIGNVVITGNGNYDETTNSSFSSMNMTINGETKVSSGETSIKTLGYLNEESWANKEGDIHFTNKQSGIAIAETCDVAPNGINFEGSLETGGETSASFNQGSGFVNLGLTSEANSEVSHNAITGEVTTGAQNEFLGGVVLGPSWASVSGKGSAYNNGPGNISESSAVGTGLASLIETRDANGHQLTGNVFSREDTVSNQQ